MIKRKCRPVTPSMVIVNPQFTGEISEEDLEVRFHSNTHVFNPRSRYFISVKEGLKFRLKPTEISVERQVLTAISVEMMTKFRLKC